MGAGIAVKVPAKEECRLECTGALLPDEGE